MQCNNHGNTKMTKESLLYFVTEMNVREKVMLIIEANHTKHSENENITKMYWGFVAGFSIWQKTLSLVLIEIRGTAISFIIHPFFWIT